MRHTKRLMCLMKKRRSQVSHKTEDITFWAAMRNARLAKGLTQEQLAEKIREKADAPWISRVESGQKDISLRTALRIAKALGVDMFLDKSRLREDD
ncbi:MAG: helix-turn-helix transcriptional regulator [Candidatus Obscuribacterales bacterium]|nr:helix-turn-helix transcriptional regulator [Candidatus Obscuribacterales bacterium]